MFQFFLKRAKNTTNIILIIFHYFYLPKIEHYKEARLWNEIFTFAESALDLPEGTIRATVLIETLGAAFQMNEILYELLLSMFYLSGYISEL